MGVQKDIVSFSIASGASTSGGADLKKGWTMVALQVASMSTSAALAVQNSIDGGTTYYNVFQAVNTSTAQTTQFLITSGVGTNGGTVLLPQGAYHNLRVIATGVVSGGVQFKAVCCE